MPGIILLKMKQLLRIGCIVCCVFSLKAQSEFTRIRSDAPITQSAYDSIRKQFLAPTPNDSTLYYHALLQLKRNNIKTAKQLIQDLKHQNSEFKGLPYLKGLLHFQTEDYAGSVAFFSEQIKLDSLHYRAWYNRALAYVKSEEVLYAIEDLDHCIRINHQNYRAYALLGYLYQFTGNYPLALQQYEKVLKLNPYYQEAYKGMAFIYNENRESDKSCAVLLKAKEKGINIDPRSLALNCPE